MADSVRTYDAIANIRRIDLAQLRSHIVDNESKFDDFVRVASAHQKGLRQRFDIDSLNINHLRVHEWLDTFPNSHPSLWSWTRSQSPDGTPGTSTSPLAPLDAASIVSSFSTSMISDGPIWSPPTLDPNAVPDSDNDILLILRQKYQQYQQYEQADPTFPPHHGVLRCYNKGINDNPLFRRLSRTLIPLRLVNYSNNALFRRLSKTFTTCMLAKHSISSYTQKLPSHQKML
ncbi:hypothetical protein SLS58_007394 [Diplodia intermedia]|uniref:Uncharacterized protein n=1 Tax=Diplodia intermedia TaxID=856260 RepID=A0ABR3TK99_9PEZI